MTALMNAWRSKSEAERKRLMLGGVLALCLSAWLLADAAVNAFRQQQGWKELYQLSNQLISSSGLGAGQIQAMAQVHSLALSEINALDQGWQLAGTGPSPASVQSFMDALASLGWYGHRWSLGLQGDRFVFALEMLPVAPAATSVEVAP